MKTSAIVVALALSSFAQHAQATELLEVQQLLTSESAREVLKQGVTTYWSGQTPPTFKQYSLPETYTATSFSPSPFGGSRRHCVDAFENALRSLIEDAKYRGFDAIVDIRPVVNGAPVANTKVFNCKPGYKITSVSLMGTLAMSDAAFDRLAEAEKASLVVAPRSAADGANFFPLPPALASTAAKEAVSKLLEIHPTSSSTPTYRIRFGPDDYSGEAELGTDGVEAACRRAVAKALEAMSGEATARKYTMIVNMRSNLNGKLSPDYQQFECEVTKKRVSVVFQATLAAK